MPTVRLDLTDDSEFKQCGECGLDVAPYNNTSLSTTPIHNLYTQTLLKYHHLNCEKCGLFIELHPSHSREEGLIFLCSSSVPHKHCLCYDCGLLYNLKTDKKTMDILSQLQYNNTSQPQSAEIESQAQNDHVISQSNHFSAMDMVNNTTFSSIEAINKENNNRECGPMSDQHDGSTLFIGTIMALLVWLGIYLNSPELFRLTGCFVWLSIFYLLTNIYFTDNDQIQRAVFGLFSFSPIIGSIYLFERSRRLNITDDIQLTLQFFCIFGCIVYFSYYWSPIKMYLFLVNDFMKLSMFQQLISVFIAISFGLFILILLKNCNFLSTVGILNEKETDFVDHDCVNQRDLEITPMVQISGINESKLNETSTKNKSKSNKKRRRRKKKRYD